MSGGLTAAGLVVLLLGLIGSGVGLYYAYICLQARPLRPKKHKDAEHGPLIPPDPDVNGNHEDVPIEASAPLDEDANANDKLHIDEPDHAPISPDLQEENSTKSPKDKEDVLISVEDDVPPAKVTHEKETAPIVSHPAPLGFVVPTSTASPQEAPLDHHPQTGNLQLQPQPQPQPQPHSQPQPQLQPQPQPQPQSQPLPQPQSQPEPSKIEVPPCSKAPVPVYIPPPQQKKPIAISDEEDGLLLQEPAPQDNSLNPELCATLPISHSPRQTGLKEEPEATPQNNPPANPPKPEAQPVVVVVPNMAPSCPEKEEVKPVGKAPDPLLSENCDKPAPLYMKEDDEHLQSAATSKDINKATPIPTTEPVPAAESIPQETVSEEPKDSINKETCVDSDDSLSTGGPHDWIDATPEFVEGTEAAKSSSEDNKTKISSEDAEVLEEPRPDSHCSVSSEEPDPPHHDPAIAEVGTLPLASPESHPKPREGPEEAVTNDTPASPTVAPEPPCDSPTPDTTEEHMSHATKEDLAPNVIVHSSADEDDALSEASSDTSDAVCDDTNIPTEAPLTPSDSDTHPGKEASATPLQPPVVVPMDAPCVPMEAYSAVPDDLSDEEGSALPVIKEEGSAENNSEGTDTESSEPEVTEYSFSSGPSAPSTTGVLANEVSCTLEPKVTKFIPIDDLDASESEGSEISDEDMEKDLTSPSDSDEEIHSPSIPLENKAMAAETSPGATEKNNTVSNHPDLSKQNISPKEKLDMSSNGPAPSESPALTPDAADKLPEEESDSGDSETESEGTEAEVEVKEEVVSIPAVVCNNTNSHIAESPVPPSANHTGSSSVACPPTAQLLKAAQGNGNSLEEIPKVTDEGDGLSVSTTESCDLSDGEVTTSTPKKSMIPRLVKQNEA